MTAPFRFSAFLAGILLFMLPAQAAVLRGRVTDAQGAPLPFATVFVAGTTTGTTTNAQGEYALQLPAGSYRIGCQYVGYQQATATIVLTDGAPLERNLVLREQDLNLKEVTIRATDEDPAYRYIRKAIAKRAVHLQQVQSFQSRIYLKGVLRNKELGDRVLGKKLKEKDRKEMIGEMGWDSVGKGVIYLCEEVADYYVQDGEDRTRVISVRESGDPSGFGLAQMPPVLSLYENNPKPFGSITPRGFVSPIADGALATYRYKLLGEFSEDGRTIYKIAVTPKHPYEPTLTGTIYLAEGDWALHSVDLYATHREGIELLDTLALRQVFLPLRPDVWVIKTQVIQPVTSLLGFAAIGNFVSVYDNQKVNEPLPEAVFRRRVTSSYAPDAAGKDSAYWSATRPIPLESDEVRDFRYKDSVRIVQESPAYRDSTRRKDNRLSLSELLVGGYQYRGRADRWSAGFGGLVWAANHNTYEGWNAAPTLSYERYVDSSNTVYFNARSRYGFGNTHFNALGTLGYRYSDKAWAGRTWNLTATGGRYVRQFDPQEPVVPLLNTFSTLLSNKEYLQLYERWEGTVALRRAAGNGWTWRLAASYQDRGDWLRPLDYVENAAFNVAILNNKAFLVAGTASYQPGVTYTDYPNRRVPNGSRWPVFSLSYTKGIPNVFQSASDFDKWRFGISDHVNLKLAGALSFHAGVGGFLNTRYVGIQDRMYLRGNQFPIAGPYLQTFQVAPYYQYANTEPIYGVAHIEYALRGFATNKIPLLRALRPNLILGTNTFFARENFWYSEAFVSFANLGWGNLRILRIDLVQSWDAVARRDFGVRLGISGPIRFSFRDNADDVGL